MLQNPKLPRPTFLQPPISLNDYLRMRINQGDGLSNRDYRELMDRKLPNSAWKDAFLESIITPEKRKRKLDKMNKNQKLDYIENLSKTNMTAAEAINAKTTKKFRVNTEVLNHVKKRQAEREHKLSKK